MLPRVILHNSISLDGRIEGFMPDIGLHYEIVARQPAEAYMAGSDTLLASAQEAPPEDESAFNPPPLDPADTRPLLVVPDSRGRVRCWHYMRQQPYWRGIIVLCSQATPKSYLEYLNQRRIDYIVAGNDYVDMRAALEELRAGYGVNTILLDSGGTLNGVMLRAGLVNEISLLVDPCLVGGAARPFFKDPASSNGVIQLKLIQAEPVKDDVVWLRYEVVNSGN
jgi:2,5-diamino-6-(ribosylamino)-4(3H)-pyrimidinone 5'-phosphate reductase